VTNDAGGIVHIGLSTDPARGGPLPPPRRSATSHVRYRTCAAVIGGPTARSGCSPSHIPRHRSSCPQGLQSCCSSLINRTLGHPQDVGSVALGINVSSDASLGSGWPVLASFGQLNMTITGPRWCLRKGAATRSVAIASHDGQRIDRVVCTGGAGSQNGSVTTRAIPRRRSR
jgi:hypothetical protein